MFLLLVIPIASPVIELKICAIAAGIKKHKPIIKKKKNENDKALLLAIANLNSIKVLINSSITHDEFVLKNKVLKEYVEMIEKVKKLKT